MADDNGLSCTPPSQEADQGALDADGRLHSDIIPRATTPELPQLCSSSTTASASPEPNLAASPAKPTSESIASKEQRTPHDTFTVHLHQQDAVDKILQSEPRSSTHEHQPALGSTRNSGHDGDGLAQPRSSPSGSTLVDQPLRGSSKKRSAPQNRFVAVSRRAGGKVTVASKHPRLVSEALSRLQ